MYISYSVFFHMFYLGKYLDMLAVLHVPDLHGNYCVEWFSRSPEGEEHNIAG